MKASLDRIELMQTFIRIVDAGSLSAAAAQMGATQPTISRRLQALEHSLGIKLLQRSTHAMQLTEDGARCYGRAKELLGSWESFEADLRGSHDVPDGTLRVMAPHAFGQQQLIDPLEAYLRRYPRVAVEWLLHDGAPDFIADGIDCAIHVGPVHDPAVVSVKLASIPRIVVAAPGLLEGKPLPRHASELASLPWLALHTFYRNEIALQHSDGTEHHLVLQPRISTDSLFAMRNAALRGLGVCVASSWAVADDVAQGKLVHLLPDWHAAPLPMVILYPYARFYPAKLRRFVEILRSATPPDMGPEWAQDLVP